MSRRSRFVVCAATSLLLAGPAWAAGYDAELDPVPFDASNREIVIDSIGDASATLDGSTLTVKGNFSNFTSPAASGSLRIGLAKGVPGDAIGTLSVDHATTGHFSGSIKLTSTQIAALKKEAIYVRIDSEKAPDGNVQGWLEGTK
jgi:CHRD domain